jgi:hypothetical protein
VLVFVLGGGAGSLPLSLSLPFTVPSLLFAVYCVSMCEGCDFVGLPLRGKKVRTMVLNKMERESPRKKRDVAC